MAAGPAELAEGPVNEDRQGPVRRTVARRSRISEWACSVGQLGGSGALHRLELRLAQGTRAGSLKRAPAAGSPVAAARGPTTGRSVLLGLAAAEPISAVTPGHSHLWQRLGA